MLIAVLADIHGNMEAFTEVLSDMKQFSVDRMFSLGDNVGYGPDPEPVMELIRQQEIVSVLGNHEKAVVQEGFIAWFNPTAQQAIQYTLDQLSSRSVRDIKELPKSRVFENLRFVHGAPPASPVLYVFQLSDEKIAKRLAGMEETVCFVGHTHDLGLISYDGKTIQHSELNPGETVLDPKKKYLINVGSVGQPRDGDSKAKYVIYDTHRHTMTLRAISYDNKTTAKKIIDAGIPETYATKLL